MVSESYVDPFSRFVWSCNNSGLWSFGFRSPSLNKGKSGLWTRDNIILLDLQQPYSDLAAREKTGLLLFRVEGFELKPNP